MVTVMIPANRWIGPVLAKWHESRNEFKAALEERRALLDKAEREKDGKYGEAMRIYDAIQKASDKPREGTLQRPALAIAVEHAVPITTPDHRWRYVGEARTDVQYGSQDCKHDRDELQFCQNILVNGGTCGRRAAFGRFILRAFGVPTTARPQKSEEAVVHWTPNGWAVCLGAGCGHGWTNTPYGPDLDFLATTQARRVGPDSMQLKRAHWIGTIVGEDIGEANESKVKEVYAAVRITDADRSSMTEATQVFHRMAMPSERKPDPRIIRSWRRPAGGSG